MYISKEREGDEGGGGASCRAGFFLTSLTNSKTRSRQQRTSPERIHDGYGKGLLQTGFSSTNCFLCRVHGGNSPHSHSFTVTRHPAPPPASISWHPHTLPYPDNLGIFLNDQASFSNSVWGWEWSSLVRTQTCQRDSTYRYLYIQWWTMKEFKFSSGVIF
jgi:hypothetical protein